MPDRIRILLLEDHALLRGALSRVLAAEPDFEIAGECAGVEEALQIVTRKPVDIVLLDLDLGNEQGGTFLNRAPGVGFRGKVLVVTAGVGQRQAAWLLQRGCTGIFLKDEPASSLVERVRGIMRGESQMDSVSVQAVVAQTAADGPEGQLTPRESLVLRYVCEGLANKEIAQKMGASENTIKSFLQQLFSKTGARSRAQLVAFAIEHYWDQI